MDDLKSALDDSSDKNRNLLITFLAVQLYILVAVGGTTDLNLLLPNSQFTLPIVNIDISLFGFYIFAPVFLLAFHFNLLFNLLEHSKKLHAWLDIEDTDQNLLHAFMLNTRAKYDENSGNYLLLNLIIVSIVSIFPLLLLLIIQWRFSDYQSYGMTLWHTLVILADIGLHVVYWRRIQHKSLLDQEYDRFGKLFSSIKSRPRDVFMYACLLLVVSTRGVMLMSTSLFPDSVRLLADQNWIFHLNVPHIDIRGMTLDPKQLGNESNTVDLQHRNLRLAKFSDQNLLRFNFSFADLRAANFSGASIQAEFDEADLDYANFSESNFLIGSSMRLGSAQHTDFSFAHLSDVDMASITSTYSIFFGTNLNGTRLSEADLSNSVFIKAEMTETSLREANLHGASFLDTWMVGIDFNDVKGLNSEHFLDTEIRHCRVNALVVIENWELFKNSNCQLERIEIVDSKDASESGPGDEDDQAAEDDSEFDPLLREVVIVTEIDTIEWLVRELEDDDYFPSITERQSAKDKLEEFSNSLDRDRYDNRPGGRPAPSGPAIDIITEAEQRNASKINLVGLDLEHLPAGFYQLKNLREIALSDNDLQDYELVLIARQFPDLERLMFAGNYLESVPALVKLTKLVRLDLSGNRLEELPDLSPLSNLIFLNLSDNNLTDLNGLEHLKRLESLDVSENELEQLPQLGDLRQLQFLSLAANELYELPSLEQLNALQTLHLWETDLRLAELRLPASLVELDLSSSELGVIPEGFDDLAQLKALYIGKTDLTDEQLRKLDSFPELRRLDVGGNDLETPDFSNFGSLVSLYIWGNYDLQEVRGLETASSLVDLDLAYSSSLKTIVGLNQLSGLQKLDLSYTEEFVPGPMDSLSSLTHLNIEGSSVLKIPGLERMANLVELKATDSELEGLSGIENLKRLERLELTGSAVSRIPNVDMLSELVHLHLAELKLADAPHLNFARLSKLRTLDLADTKVASLKLPKSVERLYLGELEEPLDFSRLTKLVELDLLDSNYTLLPSAICKLTRLKKISVTPKLESPPYEVARNGITDICNWFEHNPQANEAAVLTE